MTPKKPDDTSHTQADTGEGQRVTSQAKLHFSEHCRDPEHIMRPRCPSCNGMRTPSLHSLRHHFGKESKKGGET